MIKYLPQLNRENDMNTKCDEFHDFRTIDLYDRHRNPLSVEKQMEAKCVNCGTIMKDLFEFDFTNSPTIEMNIENIRTKW